MPMDLTGILNVNEFYSHHYLDSVLEGDLKGLFTKWKESEEKSPVQKLEGLTSKYYKAKSAALGTSDVSEKETVSTNWHMEMLSALGYKAIRQQKYLEKGNAIDVLLAYTKFDAEFLWIIEVPFMQEEDSIFDYLMFNNNNVDEYAPITLEENIDEIFRQNEAPKWLLVMSGQKVMLLHRHKWGQGKYLLFDLDEILGRKQQETIKATAALLSKDSLLPTEGEVLLDTLDENSHKHAFSVSEDLKYGIRKAIELLGNEYIYYRSKVAKQKIYGDPDLANKLTQESLSYMYRLLFLFYAESRGEELNLVPVKSEEYRLGYSLESLRDLEQVPLVTEKAREGYYLHESLIVLFKIINDGYGNERQLNYEFETNEYVDNGFDIKGLRSQLFDLKQTPLLSSIKIRNAVLQDIIQLLSLSKEGSKQRGRISYAQLGINQLGAVYEGLLSYSGFFGDERLFEVKPEGSKDFDEVYFVPESKINDYKESEFVYEVDEIGHSVKRVHERGTFIFRLAGRDREKSASYYTPEVLTQSLVKYSLKELLKDKTADEVLELKVCEPAMGSGAFLNETINQLAEIYLTLKQKELKQTIPVDEYVQEKQKVKYYIAANNIYGVDMNPVAIELAKVSLWLNVISDQNDTPWFSHKLANGNSLMGARLAVFDENLQIKQLKSFTERKKGEFYHFLVLDEEMIGFDNDKIVKGYFSEEAKKLVDWRKEISSINIEFYREDLEMLSLQIDELIKRYINKRNNLLVKTAPKKNVWGYKENTEVTLSIEDKEKLLKELHSQGTEYSILKTIFDYWTSLWIWPVNSISVAPNQEEFLNNVKEILNSFSKNEETNEYLKQSKGLVLSRELCKKNKFLHWYLEYPEIFEKYGGFNLIIGNPPWIKLAWEESGILSENYPLINIRKVSAKQVTDIREELLNNVQISNEYLSEYTIITGQKRFLNNYFYEQLKGIQTNLYKNFIILSFDLATLNGVVSFVHHEGIYDDPKGNYLRNFLYPKMRYHFHYINELMLFAEVGHPTKFGCTIFRNSNQDEITFYNVSNLFHPKTLEESFLHDGAGLTPGLKSKSFEWETKGHSKRIIKMDNTMLSVINDLFEENTPLNETKLINIHSQELIEVLRKLADYSVKLNKYQNKIYSSEMYHETNDQKKENIKRNTHFPKRIDGLVLSGPHFFVSTPIYQTPNENCKSHGDYSKIDLKQIDSEYLPRTNYEILNTSSNPKFNNKDVTEYNRIIFRKMLNINGERTLIGALYPKGPSHIHGCMSLAFEDTMPLILYTGMTSSIVLDFYIRITGKSNLGKVLFNLPTIDLDSIYSPFIINRVLRLNCLNKYYCEIWKEAYKFASKNDNLVSSQKHQFKKWEDLSEDWSKNQVLTSDLERRYALIEIDVLVALVLGLSIEELITIYNIQFSVLQKYEVTNYYDAKGQIVTSKLVQEYQKTHQLKDDYELPLIQCDRVEDMKQAYKFFSEKLK